MDEMLKTLSRIKSTQDGKDFISFLQRLSQLNYSSWKRSPNEMNDVCKGQAIAIDDLMELFESCDERLRVSLETPVSNEWI